MNPTTPTNTQQIKKRSVIGAVAFTVRTFLLQGIGAIAFTFLAAFLTEVEFGIFFIVDATVGLLAYFSDIGLAAALIQKKQDLTRADLTTTFTIQQILVITLAASAILLTPQVASFFGYGPAATFLYQALIVAFFLSSLKTIPSIILERKLDFNKLVIPQILENISFYSIVVYMAWQGFGVKSYAVGVIARGIIGLIAIYIVQPWKPGLGFDKKVAKKLISFGGPFQVQSILALVKDRLLIIFLGKVLGPGPVGLLGWAEKWAQLPIRFFTDPVLRVTFPAYSRLRHNPDELKKAIEKSVFFVSFLVFPAIVGMIAVAPHLLKAVESYNKWTPALAALSLYGINTMFSSVSITLTNTLNATGKVKTTLKLMVMWTILTWVLTIFLIDLIGFTGVALASALTASTSLIAYYLVNKIVKINLIKQTIPSLLGAATMLIIVRLAATLLTSSIPNTILLTLIGASVYFIAMILLAKKRLLQESAILKKYLIPAK